MDHVASSPDEDEVLELLDVLSGSQTSAEDYMQPESLIRTATFCKEVLNLFRSATRTVYEEKAHKAFIWKVGEIYKHNLVKHEGLLTKPLDTTTLELRQRSKERLIALYERKAGIMPASIAQAA